ncbi:TetR/AcrR family transcriptional regulator [Actinotalea caeni]|uniref:TetR/AcrR family transcriptional regulator n=1 Tax=Actinotalea caeni TaxID=1348467 RepID=UPI0012E2FF8D|nr:TetR/AcrR family transcriptional regulator [Actinotalea caeni]
MVETALRTDKRRAILDAAGPVFGDVGYERASVDAIAAAAGVSKPTIYAYFGSKEQLFRDTLADIARQLYEASYDAVRDLDLGADRWRAALHDLAYALAAPHRSGCTASLSRLALAESRRDPEVVTLVQRAGYEPVLEALAGRLAMLANTGALRIPDASLAARHLLALTQATLADLTGCGAHAGDDGAVRAATDAGVDVFLRAYEA